MTNASPTPVSKPLLDTLNGKQLAAPALWLMRQAGRYLPEYRKLRAEADTFLDLCFTPDLAVEVTLQPLRRFGFDGAILFSDILVVPHALGQKVWFEEGSGPRLEALNGPSDLGKLSPDALHAALAPVYETLRRLRTALTPKTTLIGFAGAPWTVASYMIEGGSTRDFARTKAWAYGDSESFQRLITLLVDATVDYLSAQVEAGAEALQIFDSWAGILPADALRRWSLAPIKEIISRVRSRHPAVPIIVFPRGSGISYQAFAQEAEAQALSLDTSVPVDWACSALPRDIVLQGNLDPIYLIVGGSALRRATLDLLAAMQNRRFIFNLGHGILPTTPPEHVAELVEIVRGGS